MKKWVGLGGGGSGGGMDHGCNFLFGKMVLDFVN
jgi:hypothetical protein